MRKVPQEVRLSDLISSAAHTNTGLMRPGSEAGIIDRIRLAWLVFTGECDALRWDK